MPGHTIVKKKTAVAKRNFLLVTVVRSNLTCLYGIIDIVIGSLKTLWTEIECGKSYVIEDLKTALTSMECGRSKQRENVEYIKHLDSVISGDARCT